MESCFKASMPSYYWDQMHRKAMATGNVQDKGEFSLVLFIGRLPRTTSLNIAEVFEKEHKDVLKAIENLQCS